MGTHQKHPPLKRSSIGSYHKCEWAIYGSDCASIAMLFNSIKKRLSNEFQLLYVDADHQNESSSTLLQTSEKQFHHNEGLKWNSYDEKLLNWPVDCVFVNGNHYPADRQIVIVDSKKKSSLEKRLPQLTQVDLVLLKSEDEQVYEFLKDRILDTVPIINIKSKSAIIDWIRFKILHATPLLKALILAGGESKRMQEDKSQISYHSNINHVKYLADIATSLGLQTYISKSHDYPQNDFEDYPVVKDKFVKMGPFGAIASAFMEDPDSAYLVLACDLPFVNKESLANLIRERNTSKFATSYKLRNNLFPEPLLTIYEPRIHQRMLSFLSLGYACPRKVLINSEVKSVTLSDEMVAFNANTPIDRDKVKDMLK